MGVLDLPAPLFAWLDGSLSFLPSSLRLVVWGVVSGIASMWMYAAVSPQRRIAEGKRAAYQARLDLDRYDGELADAWPLIRLLLATSLRQVTRVMGPALLASLPVLSILVWLSSAYGYGAPDATTPIRVEPEPLHASWHQGSGRAPQIDVHDPRRGLVTHVTLNAPVPVIEKRHWWNLLVGNPAGYLPPDSEVERVLPELPRLQHLPFGPAWMRGWELLFVITTLLASLALKRWRGIH